MPAKARRCASLSIVRKCEIDEGDQGGTSANGIELWEVRRRERPGRPGMRMRAVLRLEQINEGFDHLAEGSVVRQLLATHT